MEFARVALMPFVLPRGIAARRLFDCRNAGLTSFLLRTIRCDIMTDMTSRRKTLKRDWFDNQPGAWVMVMLPAVAGFFIGGPNLDTLWLLATWAVCYCVQFSAAHWFKAHFSRRYLPPMLTYAVALIVIGLPFLITHTGILRWTPLIYSAGCAVDAVLVAEEGALAVGQCRVGDCRVGHGHGDRVVWQHC